MEYKVMEYKVIELWRLDSFENEINNLLKQNWELVGGISTAYDRINHRFFYTQAMVRKNKG